EESSGSESNNFDNSENENVEDQLECLFMAMDADEERSSKGKHTIFGEDFDEEEAE
ncbi:hypothetical protein KI387_007998, partial [Taxus chinensis]